MRNESVRAWILKAESDLKVARDELVAENPATVPSVFMVNSAPKNTSKLT